jgi:hypothetical protein
MMISQDELNYLNKYLIKSGERLDFSSNNSCPSIELKIIKQTEWTYRVVGLLTLMSNVRKPL